MSFDPNETYSIVEKIMLREIPILEDKQDCKKRIDAFNKLCRSVPADYRDGIRFYTKDNARIGVGKERYILCMYDPEFLPSYQQNKKEEEFKLELMINKWL